MHIKARDLVATVIFAAILVPYLGYVINGSMPFVQDPRGMASVGLLGMFLMMIAFGGRESLTGGSWVMIGTALVGVGLGIAALVLETNETVLAAFIGALSLYWALALLFDTGVIAESRAKPRLKTAS
jgi:hypothetical protein